MSKIMVVEDDASLREIYSIRITAEGYDVVSAGDGEEALAVAVREKPDLILSDVMMPKISGFDMLDILRSTPEVSNIKVIMMTALSADDQRQRGERLGADRYLVKSQVGIEDVINAIHEVLGDKQVSSPSQADAAVPNPADAAAPATAAAPSPTVISSPNPASESNPVAANPMGAAISNSFDAVSTAPAAEVPNVTTTTTAPEPASTATPGFAFGPATNPEPIPTSAPVAPTAPEPVNPNESQPQNNNVQPAGPAQ